MDRTRAICRSIGWGLLLALGAGLSHAQPSTRLIEGLAAIGGIRLNLNQATTPASPQLAAHADAQPCLADLEQRRTQLEKARLPEPAGNSDGHTLASSAKPPTPLKGPTATQTQTLQMLFNEIHTICEESALLESSPSLAQLKTQNRDVQAAITGPAPTDWRALYAHEVQADQEEQALNGIQALRESNQRQLQRLQSRLPVDNTAGDAAPGAPAGATSEPWDSLIADARLSLAVHQLQHLQALDALLARQFTSGTAALKMLQARLLTWREQTPFSSEELALIRAQLLSRIHRLETPRTDAAAHAVAAPDLRSGVSDAGSMPQGFWSQLLRQTQIDLDQRNLLAWQWRYELFGPHLGDLKILATQLDRQNQDLQALERSISPLLDNAWPTDPPAAGPSPALQGPVLHHELLSTLGLLNETRQNMRILASELQQRLETLSPLRRTWDQARDGLNTWAHQVWDFNLLTLTEKISVNGQDITTTQNITIGKSIGAVLVLLVGYLLGAWLLRLMRKSLVGLLGVRTNTADRIYWIAKAVLVAVLLIFAMSLVNIPLSALSLPGGVLAVGLGFGAQNLLKNLIGALILQLTHPVKLNDYIVLNQHSGFVKSMGWQFCVVRGFDGDESIVPNVDMLSGSLVNWTFKDLQMRCSITVGVAYGSPTQMTMDLLVEAAKQAAFVLQDPAPVVYFTDFGDSTLVFQLKFWVEMGSLNPHVIETDVRLRINEAMRTANITISFPQRDVHLYQTEPLQVDVRQKSV